MRRLLLILIAINSYTWAQSVQAPAQPPIVVQLQMPHTPLWLQYAPYLAMAIAILVALMQAYLQREKQKQDLFDRRFKVYEGTLSYLTVMLRDEGRSDIQTDLQQYREFRDDTDPAEWLFGSDVCSFIKNVGGASRELHRLQSELEHCISITRVRVTGTDQDEIDHRYNEALNKIMPLQHEIHELLLTVIRFWEGEAKQVFRRYLTLHHDRWWTSRFIDRIHRWVDQDLPADMASRYRS